MQIQRFTPMNYNQINVSKKKDFVVNEAIDSKPVLKQNQTVGYYLPFQSKWITKAEQKALLEGLDKCKQGKPKSIQKAYDIGKDFVNKKISKNEYLAYMDSALLKVNTEGAYTNEKELEFTREFLLLSFMEDFSKFVTKEQILNSLNYLVD